MSVDWGDVPTWIAAVSATVAAIASGMFLVRDHRSLADLQQEARERKLADRRAQASRVVLLAAEEDEQGTFHVLRLENASDLPIFRVRFTRAHPENYTLGLPSGSELLAPHTADQIPLGGDGVITNPMHFDQYYADFVDADERYWRRFANGRLSEMHYGDNDAYQQRPEDDG